MKIRMGFVSNSSSSSFIINKSKLTKDQINAIWNHIDYSKEHNIPCFSTEYKDEWNIVETDEIIGGETTMANFDMDSFLVGIGVNLDDVEIEGQDGFEIFHKVRDIRDEQAEKIFAEMKKRPIEKEVSMPFRLRTLAFISYLHCDCPECGNQFRIYPKDIDHQELIEEDVGFVIRCRECNRFFRLLDNTDVWKWGLVEKGKEQFSKDKMHIFTKELERRVYDED